MQIERGREMKGRALCRIFILLSVCALIQGRGVFSAAVQLEGTARILEVRGTAVDDHLGRPLLCADLDHDGCADIIVGADRWDFTGGERPTLYIFRGRSSFEGVDLIDLSVQSADVVIYGETLSDNLANALAAGDVNNDGIMDLVAADSTLEVAARAGAGAVYVLFGRPDFFSRHVYDFKNGDWDVKILGAKAGDDTGGYNAFGGLISSGLVCGDINYDHVDDIAIGAHLGTIGNYSAAGKVYIVYGSSSFAHGKTIDLLSQPNSTILGNEEYAELGTMLRTADLNGDGIIDLIMGEEYGSVGTFTTEGKVFVFWGRTNFPASLSVTNADLTIIGAHTWDELGSAVALSDVNGDARKDLIIAAGGWDHSGITGIDEGAIYGLFGGASFPSTISLASQQPSFFVEGYNTSNDIGATLVPGDFNGDGIGDIMFSSRDGERAGFNIEGRTFIIMGQNNLPSHFSVQAEDFDYIINGGVDNFQLGDSIASGDIDGGGVDEILIGAPFYDNGRGRLLVFDLHTGLGVASPWALYE